MANATAKFGNKTHTQVLPTHLDIPIKEQFGFFPTSGVYCGAGSTRTLWEMRRAFSDGAVGSSRQWFYVIDGRFNCNLCAFDADSSVSTSDGRVEQSSVAGVAALCGCSD